MIPRLTAAAVAVALLAAACSSGGGGSSAAPSRPGSQPSPAPSVVITRNTAPPPHSSIAKIVAEVLPSVVNIKVQIVAQGVFGGLRKGRAEGSGVVISPNGIILTNNHVVQQALQVRVALNDGRTLNGTVIGNDPQHDLAVVKVDAGGLNPITVGDSSKLRLGDTVVAIGFPLNLGGPTVTSGIVSGLKRSVRVQGDNGQTEHLKDLIQTDAAINPGNSGGALVDASGRLVGINTAAASAAAAENVGFAIAIDQALPIVRRIISHPSQQGAFMGVSVASLDTRRAAALFGVPKGTPGAGVVGVIPGSPAARAGIKAGDIIVAVDSHSISSPDELTSVLHGYSPGDRVTVKVRRGAATRTFTLILAQRPVGIGSTPRP